MLAVVGTPFSIPAIDLQDIIADDDGGVVLVTRGATNGGTPRWMVDVRQAGA